MRPLVAPLRGYDADILGNLKHAPTPAEHPTAPMVPSGELPGGGSVPMVPAHSWDTPLAQEASKKDTTVVGDESEGDSEGFLIACNGKDTTLRRSSGCWRRACCWYVWW